MTDPVEVRLFKKLAYESLTKRHHYPDGETRPWNINEVVSGNVFKALGFVDATVDPAIDLTDLSLVNDAKK